VRELENFIERSVILSRGSALNVPIAELRSQGLEAVDGTLANMERQLILHVLRATGGVISTTARRLGIPRTTLNAMMQKLGISRQDL
jgi:DNA-binding NtrC family response regulator